MYYIVVYGWTLLTNVVKTLHSGVQIFDLMYSILYCCKISNISVLLARPVGCCSWSTFRQLTDQDVSGLYFRHYFLFFLFLQSTTLLIEGVIKSKILFRERKNEERKLSRSSRSFWSPLATTLCFEQGWGRRAPGLNLLNGLTDLQPKKSDWKSLRYLNYKFAVISEPSHVTKY